MRRSWQFFSDYRILAVIGLVALGALLVLGAEALELSLMWIVLVALALLLAGGAGWLLRRQWRRAGARQLSDGMLQAKLEAASQARDAEAERGVLQKDLIDAIATIKSSKLGQASGAAALYELPWYMIIGNRAAGKSSAIGRSGLQFPLGASKAGHGVGGTRHCDWFFTTDGIVLDTAGRYSVQEGDREEWFGFLALLRKHRPRAPINGILIAVSVDELTRGDTQASVELAQNLRTRVQELTERLAVFAPVYLIFTKVDRIAGFGDFFHDAERAERERVWGATIRYNRRRTPQDVVALFDRHFDELHDGLMEMSLANMAGKRSTGMRPGVLTFPLEFANTKSALRTFLGTLFDENSYQFRPVLRGFYFTCALQEGEVRDLSSQRVASRFGLEFHEPEVGDRELQGGYFLHELFRKVIFADKDLVSRFTSAAKWRFKLGVFLAASVLLGCALGGWSWSFMGNRQLVANVQADLDKVLRLQDKRIDLQSRLEALDILQDRIVQLEHYRSSAPLALSFGLYQGAKLERKLRDEYFAGVREVMVLPVAAGLEALLAEMNANAAQLDPAAPAAAPKPDQPYQDASPANVADGYNALKAYLMLGDKSRAEPGHLNDQMTRYWRGWLAANRGNMPQEQMIRCAERLISFHLDQVLDPAWPQITPKLGLLDSARENLRRVVRGTPARDRIYADIKARAATRFPAVTVARIVGEQDRALIGGSHAVSGAFTRAAWDQFVQGAFRDAANKELRSADWVLKTETRDDLTLEGSPEQIQKGLADLYQAEYTKEWLKFVQGVTVSELGGFEASVQAMNRLGDPQTSPIAKLLQAIDQETSWDKPAQRAVLAQVGKGFRAWFVEVVLRRAPGEARALAAAGMPHGAADAPAMGPIAREFAGVARLVGLREKDASLMSGYLDCLSRLRGRLNQLKNQGDPGPGAMQLMRQTLEGSGSELADALKYVDEQMLTGMSDSQKLALRPLLVRPLVQTFAVIVLPSESEINKTWQAQVVEPFRKGLAGKYPFTQSARIEASQAEIGQLFGPDGALARFVTAAMGPLVVRRGDVLAARTWAGLGVTLSPRAVAGFPGWIAPLSVHGVAAPAGPQTVFQLQPSAAAGTSEYTIEIDGQRLRYRNTAPAWTNMVHPSPQGVPGARITAVTVDGREVELFNEAGQFGLKRMIDAATRKRKEGGVFELRWSAANVTVAVDLKIVSSADTAADSGAAARGFAGLSLPDTIVGRVDSGATVEKAGSP
ncbi:MAG: type VI secretion system membrane subunit TssM [Pseudomonadota bacterium]